MGTYGSDGTYHAFRSSLPLKLNDFRIVDGNGDVGDTTANGGLFSSNTAPILRGNAAETQELSWVSSNSTAISAQFDLPEDFDGNQDVLVDLWVNSGTTDLASFTVETGWDDTALVSDAATDPAASATTHKITARIAAADIPNSPSFMTLALTPGAHTTNAIQLLNVRVSYLPKTVS